MTNPDLDAAVRELYAALDPMHHPALLILTDEIDRLSAALDKCTDKPAIE